MKFIDILINGCPKFIPRRKRSSANTGSAQVFKRLIKGGTDIQKEAYEEESINNYNKFKELGKLAIKVSDVKVIFKFYLWIRSKAIKGNNNQNSTYLWAGRKW